MRIRHALAPVLAGALALAFSASTPAHAAGWAPAATATVHPGVQTYTGGAQCTANFVFQAAGVTYLGQAAHCSGTGAATETDGCLAESLPLGTPVEVAGYTGTLVYNSWIAMKAAGTTDAETCAYNDFALIQLPAAAVADTNPSVPFFGGPTALGTTAASGSNVYSYGNSSLRFGLSPLSPKRGVAVSTTPGGWSSTVYTVTPGIPGDSGSGFLDSTGAAIGTLSTVAVAPLPLSNNIGNLAKEIAFAQSHGVAGLTLVPGTEAFSGSRLI